ncbi:glycosyltransferase family 4 protein [Octadecabacter sp. CECT 8868]|uniref:glycosyltransferase family 4 protein n=1 Tax=Octadecabacter algicola TaxID=2909342 RepID=UPI001F447D06|nr:glycosyltransferase family 4 protein [Octadecabacter algicola]MCF2906675.1 glycosyltransferase family 4 protein [Octadecabacter algicola]
MSEQFSKPRIAYLTSEYPAVSHTFILREVEALRRLGRDVLTCSIRQTGPEHHRGPSEQAAVKDTFYVLKSAKSPLNLLASLAYGLSRPKQLWNAIRLAFSTRPAGIKALIYQMIYLVEALVLARHLSSQNIHHLHNHFGNSSCTVAMLVSTLSGIPFSYTMHGPSIFFEPRRWRIDEKIARAQFVACISHFCRSQGMIFADPAHWDRMRIVHCGVEPAKYAEPRTAPQGKTMIFVGRLAAVKGVRVLIEAFAEVQKADPEARLVLVGDGPERGDIESYIAELGCEDGVRLAGYLSQDEVAEELRAADLFVLPSFAEGVPVVLMEALASGLPVIATRIAGIGELVTPGETGELVAPGDVAGLTTAITTLLNDADMRNKMGENGRIRVEADYNIDREAAWLDRLVTDLNETPTLRP